jgi:hypothetical protein
MLALDLLCVTLPHRVAGSGEMAFIDARAVGIKVDQTEGPEELLPALETHLGSGP